MKGLLLNMNILEKIILVNMLREIIKKYWIATKGLIRLLSGF